MSNTTGRAAFAAPAAFFGPAFFASALDQVGEVEAPVLVLHHARLEPREPAPRRRCTRRAAAASASRKRVPSRARRTAVLEPFSEKVTPATSAPRLGQKASLMSPFDAERAAGLLLGRGARCPPCSGWGRKSSQKPPRPQPRDTSRLPRPSSPYFRGLFIKSRPLICANPRLESGRAHPHFDKMQEETVQPQNEKSLEELLADAQAKHRAAARHHDARGGRRRERPQARPGRGRRGAEVCPRALRRGPAPGRGQPGGGAEDRRYQRRRAYAEAAAGPRSRNRASARSTPSRASASTRTATRRWPRSRRTPNRTPSSR